MLETNGKSERGIAGIDQQDFDKIQLVSGMYPYQNGLQKRFPGKSIQETVNGPVGAILVFYMVYGRNYVLTDFGTLQIEEVVPTPYVPPVLPPSPSGLWMETFDNYSISQTQLYWTGGSWGGATVGRVEKYTQEIIDPFDFIDDIKLFPGSSSGGSGSSGGGSGGSGGSGKPGPSANDPNFVYPDGRPDIVLINATGNVNNSCYGQGVQFVNYPDFIQYFVAGVVTDTYYATYQTVGSWVVWHGHSIGRLPDDFKGSLKNSYPEGSPFQCGGATPPTPNAYYITAETGLYGIQT